MRLKVGYKAPDFNTIDVLLHPIQLQSFIGKKIYITFLRNTHCPMCSLHLFKLLRVINVLNNRGLEVIIFYESSPEMFNYSPFFRDQILKENKMTIISDQERKIYDLFGAEISPQKATLEVFQAAQGRMGEYQEALKLGFKGDGIEKNTNPDAIPADFLIDENLTIKHAHYGNDTGDHTSISLIESFAMNSSSI